MVLYLEQDHGRIGSILDPCLALIANLILVSTSIQMTINVSVILLQSLPVGWDRDMAGLEKLLLDVFPEDVVSVHEVHIWSLTPQTSVATLHIVFQSEKVVISCKVPSLSFYLVHS